MKNAVQTVYCNNISQSVFYYIVECNFCCAF